MHDMLWNWDPLDEQVESKHLALYSPVGHFNKMVLEAYDKDPGHVEINLNVFTEDPVISACFHALHATLANGNALEKLYIDSVITMINVHVLSYYCTRRYQTDHCHGGLRPYLLRRVTDYMHAHCKRDMSLEELSAIVGLSTYHFARMFKHSTGTAPHQYLMACRVNKAAELLTHTQLPVADIAAAVGYQNIGHFRRIFSRSKGLTPSKYRRAVER